MDTVSVVIPNFNGKDLLEKHLPSVLAAFAYKKNKIVEVIIVDDGSSDGSVGFIKKNHASVRLISHKKNRGFAYAVNTGVRSAKGELVVLLNSDVDVSVDFVEHTLGHFKDPKAFGVSLHEKGYGHNKGRFIDGFIVHEGQKETTKTQSTFWANGGSSILRRSLYIKLGGLDDQLTKPFYWEDIDLSYRAQKRGYKILWEPKAKVIHVHESTIKQFPKKYKNLVWERNQLLFIWKNLTSPNMFRKHLSGLAGRLVKHPGYIKVILFALFRLQRVFKARKKELKESRVSDEAVFGQFS